MDNLNKISRLKFVQISDFYIETNLVTQTEITDGYFRINLEARKPLKILLNMRLLGILNIDTSVYFSSCDINNDWFDIVLEKEFGKKQYDGTTLYTVDISSFDCNIFIDTIIFFGEEFVILNNITVEFEESFISLDYKSYKSAVLKEISN